MAVANTPLALDEDCLKFSTRMMQFVKNGPSFAALQDPTDEAGWLRREQFEQCKGEGNKAFLCFSKAWCLNEYQELSQCWKNASSVEEAEECKSLVHALCDCTRSNWTALLLTDIPQCNGAMA
eukprot:GEMP01085923.1.p1 GENE.GEMP01085923.1~~GEMP01085923.1.p1  ORF type:complete len:123 (+),score=28.46 GEMP01085923.1:124-492(+)